MATTKNEPTPGHAIGTTTIGSSGAAGTGAGLGAAIGAVIVFAFEQGGVDLGPIEWAIVAITSAALAFGSGLVGGKFSPSNAKPIEITIPEVAGPGVAGLTVPDGDGEHRATDPTDELDAAVEYLTRTGSTVGGAA